MLDTWEFLQDLLLFEVVVYDILFVLCVYSVYLQSLCSLYVGMFVCIHQASHSIIIPLWSLPKSNEIPEMTPTLPLLPPNDTSPYPSFYQMTPTSPILPPNDIPSHPTPNDTPSHPLTLSPQMAHHLTLSHPNDTPSHPSLSSQVYLAQHKYTGKQVAIKVMSQSRISRYLELNGERVPAEIALIANLAHTSIIQVLYTAILGMFCCDLNLIFYMM